MTKPTIIKYSKPSVAVIKNKESFFLENQKLLDNVTKVNDFYKKQPPRNTCKTCPQKLGEIDLHVHGIPYSICKNCNHFNGRHEDTKAFSEFLYSDSDGANHSKGYLNTYDDRVNDIYTPKVKFLKEVLDHYQESDFSVTDIGCGGGHFVKACENENIMARGYDSNKALIGLGLTKLSTNKIAHMSFDLIDEVIQNTDTKVLSMIGVLEHLMDPISALQAFQSSKADYLYLQVPLFSFAAIQESMHDSVFPRQLCSGHTHLYTKESLNFLCNKFNLIKAGEWWFGTDIVDLFRHANVLAKGESNKKSTIQKYIGEYIDELQEVFDRNKMCSGVNMVLKKSSVR